MSRPSATRRCSMGTSWRSEHPREPAPDPVREVLVHLVGVDAADVVGLEDRLVHDGAAGLGSRSAVSAGMGEGCLSSASTAHTSRSRHRPAHRRQARGGRASPPRCPPTTSALEGTAGRVGLRVVVPGRRAGTTSCRSAWSTRPASATTRRSWPRRRLRSARCSPAGSGWRWGPERPRTSTSPASRWPTRPSAKRACVSAWTSCERCSQARSWTTTASCASTARGSGRCPPSRRP